MWEYLIECDVSRFIVCVPSAVDLGGVFGSSDEEPERPEVTGAGDEGHSPVRKRARFGG